MKYFLYLILILVVVFFFNCNFAQIIKFLVETRIDELSLKTWRLFLGRSKAVGLGSKNYTFIFGFIVSSSRR